MPAKAGPHRATPVHPPLAGIPGTEQPPARRLVCPSPLPKKKVTFGVQILVWGRFMPGVSADCHVPFINSSSPYSARRLFKRQSVNCTEAPRCLRCDFTNVASENRSFAAGPCSISLCCIRGMRHDDAVAATNRRRRIPNPLALISHGDACPIAAFG